MWQEYRRLSYAFWEGQGNPTLWLVPDAVMVPLLDGFLPQFPDIERDALKVKRDAAVESCRLTQEDVVHLVRSIWQYIGGEDASLRLDEMLAERPVKLIAEGHPFFGKSGGDCGENGINFYFDGSLSDAIYLAHETGHFVADRDGFSPKNVTEIQAFFLQEAAYDCIRQMKPELSEALRLHRFDEYTAIGNHLRWADMAVRKERPDDKDEDRSVFNAHRHPVGCVLASDMYARFKDMNEQSRKSALNVLFNSGPDVRLPDILSAFGLNDAEAIKKAGQSYSKRLASDAVSLGFLKVSTGGQAKVSATTVKL